MSVLVVAIALSPLVIVVPALGMAIRRMHIYRRMPRGMPVYEFRYAARSISIILAMDVGLILFNIVCVLVLGGSIIGNGISTLVILAVARWQLGKYRQMLAKAYEAEEKEIAKLRIPDHVPDDL